MSSPKVSNPRQLQICSCLLLVLLAVFTAGCRQEKSAPPLEVPRGYVPTIQIERGDRLLTFGPFVGYYFRPVTPDNLERLHFVCFNERSFYTRDLPQNSKLFEGEAILRDLDDVGFIPADGRINPVMFAEAPEQWLANRPEPQDEFLHFHSCYDARGPVLTGYWVKHVGMANFVYDMGGRVGTKSVLYHEVSPSVDTSFARLMEFDRGTGRY